MSLRLVQDTVTPDLERRLTGLDGALLDAFRNIGLRIVREAITLAFYRFKKSTRYVHSFKLEIPLPPRGVRIINVHPAARLLEFGSLKKGYPIYPKRGRYLRFFKEGQWKLRRMVVHPGIRGYYIIVDAIKATHPYTCRRIARAFREAGR